MSAAHASLEDIRNLSYEELVEFVKTQGEPAFRADQIFEWIYQKMCGRLM